MVGVTGSNAPICIKNDMKYIHTYYTYINTFVGVFDYSASTEPTADAKNVLAA